MKKPILLLFVVLSLVIMACNSTTEKSEDPKSNEPELLIKTNYFDLTDDASAKLQDILDTKNLSTISSNNSALQEYISGSVFGYKNPNGPYIGSNYFWYIYNGLPDFVNKKERHAGYYAGEGDHSENQRLLAYSLYRIDRSSENIEKIFQFFKPVLKELVFPSSYESLGINIKVKGLISCYDEIIKIEDYKKQLTNAYNQADTATGYFIDMGDGKKQFEKFSGAYGFTSSDLSIIIGNNLNIDRHSSFYSSPDLSFWMRRNKEGNIETVYQILLDINELYIN